MYKLFCIISNLVKNKNNSNTEPLVDQILHLFPCQNKSRGVFLWTRVHDGAVSGVLNDLNRQFSASVQVRDAGPGIDQSVVQGRVGQHPAYFQPAIHGVGAGDLVEM